MLTRVTIPEMDAVLGQKFPVLDDGFVYAVDYMGGDESIVQAARVSYGKGTKKMSEDRGLIRYLMRHRHTTPFEMCDLKLHVRVPMDCWRQWIRHRTASVNEYSTRYSIAIDGAQQTESGEWRLQTKGNRQGSDGFLDEASTGRELTARERTLHREMREVYKERIDAGVAREQARKDLPLATYTEAYWKINLHNLLHFLSLRMDSHAQQEIREYATTIGEKIVARWVPLVWEAFLDYRMNALYLTGIERSIISVLLLEGQNTARAEVESIAKAAGWLEMSKKTGKLKRNRERVECEEKLYNLGLMLPWEHEGWEPLQ